MSETKEFSVSANGDRWSLDTNDGEAVVVHLGNEPSGGHETRTALADFLAENAGKPEHGALLEVLGQSQDEIEHQLGDSQAEISTSSNDHPKQDPAEGSRYPVERNLAYGNKDGDLDHARVNRTSRTCHHGRRARSPHPNSNSSRKIAPDAMTKILIEDGRIDCRA